jgi:hypothetical protein
MNCRWIRVAWLAIMILGVYVLQGTLGASVNCTQYGSEELCIAHPLSDDTCEEANEEGLCTFICGGEGLTYVRVLSCYDHEHPEPQEPDDSLHCICREPIEG